jgi:hypothetical protein
VVSHEIDNAEIAYEKFDKRIKGCTRVLIHPNGPFVEETVKLSGVHRDTKG